jgi:hypothetical protein
MQSQYIFTYHTVYHKNKKLSFLLSGFCLLLILGFGIICYDDDLSDTNSPPVIALQCPIIYFANDQITLTKLISESINLPLVNKNSFLSRSPPI